MLNKEFTINLTEPIKPGKVTIGYFDGVHPSIVAVTRSDKIFVHNPHNRSVLNSNSAPTTPSDTENGEYRMGQFTTASSGNDLNFLNINQTITCVAAGPLSTTTVTKSNESIVSSSAKSSGHGRKTSTRRKSLLNNDVLVVGTSTSVHVYDILHNTDLYYKEIPDGANTAIIGRFGTIGDGNIALIGGNCAIHGFDRDGNDMYWMVTGDNITAMALVDIDDDNQNELVVGSEDCEIQVFKQDAITSELRETDLITGLCTLGPQMYAYSLSNGTVGVYQTNGERLWRIKSKNLAVCLLGVDVNNDGQMELLTGWSNGKLDIRIAHTGEVLYRENFKCSIAGIMVADYNMDGKNELMVCTVSGEVFGYHLDSQQERHKLVDSNFEQETIRELMKKKQTLLQELRNYEENTRVQNMPDPLVMNKGKVLNEMGDPYGAIPANTKLKSLLLLKQVDETSMGYIELQLETTNSTEIRAVIVFAEGIFKNESMIIYPSDEDVSSIINVPLRPPKDMYVDMHIKALVGYRISSHYHVFELTRHLPKFAMYALCNSQILNRAEHSGFDDYSDLKNAVKDDLYQDNTVDPTKFYSTIVEPKSFVIIRVMSPISKVVDWVNKNFLLDNEFDLNEQERSLEFVSLRNRKALIFHLNRNDLLPSQSTENFFEEDEMEEYKNSNFKAADLAAELINGVVDEPQSVSIVKIFCDSIEVAGNCVQSLGEYLEMSNLPCTKALFPEEIEHLKQLVDRVEEIQSVRQHLVAEVADSANLIRSAVVQAEDARLTQEYQRMKEIYSDLSMLNRDILREHKIRCQNHQDLVDCLKQINLLIQRASNLRIGTYKSHFITACREAIKQKNFTQLFKIISED